MRGIRYILIAAIALGIAGISAATGPMTLTGAGDLYAVATHDNQVVVTARYADGTVSELIVPQSAAAVANSLQVGVDETTGALYVLWQKKTGMDARLRVASYIDDTWIGPITFAGNDGTAAYNPQLLIHRAVSVITEDGNEGEEPVVTELATTFLHLTWWSQTGEEDVGIARYAAVAINDQGKPQFWNMAPVDLIDLLPYGIACFDIEVGDNLKYPKLFIEPKTGNPHVFATDLANCIFQILELDTEVVDDDWSNDRPPIRSPARDGPARGRRRSQADHALGRRRGRPAPLPRARRRGHLRNQEPAPRRDAQPRGSGGSDPRLDELTRNDTSTTAARRESAGRFA